MTFVNRARGGMRRMMAGSNWHNMSHFNNFRHNPHIRRRLQTSLRRSVARARITAGPYARRPQRRRH